MKVTVGWNYVRMYKVRLIETKRKWQNHTQIHTLRALISLYIPSGKIQLYMCGMIDSYADAFC